MRKKIIFIKRKRKKYSRRGRNHLLQIALVFYDPGNCGYVRNLILSLRILLPYSCDVKSGPEDANVEGNSFPVFLLGCCYWP